MLSPSITPQKHGHASLEQSSRPGLPRALVISKYPKLRTEIVKTLQSVFEVEYFSSTDAVLPTLLKGKTPGLIVIDYRQLVSHSRDFIYRKMESEKLANIPILVTGRVDQETFNETVRMVCRVEYLQRPFLQSQLRDKAVRLLDSPLEDDWKVLPHRQKSALQKTLSTIRDATKRIKLGQPLNIYETKESCEPVMEEVLCGNAAELVQNVEGHNNHAFVHSLKVATLLTLLGNAIGIKDTELLTITTGGFLMDVGKLKISADLLNRTNKLSKSEYNELKKHVFHSHTILDQTENVSEGIKVIAEQHHERLDGSGYPRGLKAKDLNELARLAAICDVFCALQEQRPYKPAYSFDQAIEVLEKMKGELDPFLLALFKQVARSFYKDPASVH